MQYRALGKTGLDVSAIGLGAAMLGSSAPEYAVQVVRRAVDLGVNYFDTARGYWDSEIKLGQALRGHREDVYISTKTGGRTRDEAWQHIRESLHRLQTEYLDNCHLHGLRAGADLEQRLGPGGALDALIEARDQGVVRHIGCTSHRSETLLQALDRFDFEVILVPLNIAEREPLHALIPFCQQRGVGVTVMKPVATGLLPAPLALKWLLQQPIATAVPGTTTIEEAEENARVGHLAARPLTPEEEAQVERLADQLQHVRCRICGDCEPCPQDIPIGSILGTDVMYDHYRTMGPQAFQAFPWSFDRVQAHIEDRKGRISAIQSCTECGACETKCPYGLSIIAMLRDTVKPMEDMLTIWGALGLSTDS